MKINLKIYSTIIGASLMLAPQSYANSYLDMITTPPQNYTPPQPVYQSLKSKPFTWYDNTITTNSPVVTSDYTKYFAYKKAEQNNFEYYSLKDTLQDTIYLLETLALGKLVYELYDN